MYRYFSLILFSTIMFFACKSQNSSTSNHTYNNHLVGQTSPYLLQHAHNPVDWHPWTDETLQKAKDEDKMILVSVGYAACHWCHVMEHESFEDTLVAKIMNENFICIKVDREERPDVDDVYMTACHLSNNRSCGWPLNSVALPDGKPIWAGTYFPKDDWMKVLIHFKDAYKNERSKLEEQAENITNGIKRSEEVIAHEGETLINTENLDKIVTDFISNIDMKKGGRNGSPKFPMPNNYNFLVEFSSMNDFPEANDAANITLEKMANGGIYDHAGGGFARYSTDDKWLVPHFEKMLYDNGQLLSLYSKAYMKTKNPLYLRTLKGIITFAERDLMSKDYGFYSSWDADSEGEEGKYYIWTKNEIDSIIGNPQNAEIFDYYYNISKKGNWEHGKNILNITKTNTLEKFKLTQDELGDVIKDGLDKLMAVRFKRIAPNTDDKVLTSWNALMLKGLTDAYKATGDESYSKLAMKNARFIKDNLIKEGSRLDRNYKNGKSNINAFLDDYVNLVEAYLGVYEMTFEKEWLFLAKDLHEYAIAHFKDANSPFYNYTSDLDKALIARKKELSDNVIPASNSVMAHNYHRLGLYFYDDKYVDEAKLMLNSMLGSIIKTEQPNFYSNWCNLLNEMVKPTFEIGIVGDNYKEVAKEMSRRYIPNAIIVAGKDDAYVELLADRYNEGETMIYVCQNKICKFPVDSVEEAMKLLMYK